jgi:hypothetical protein
VSRGGLYQGSSRRHGALQCARWRQALPAPGLPQGSCYWRHAPLHRTRWRQAVSEGGLLQVGSRRHGALQCARWRQALPAPGLPQGSCYWRHAPLHRTRGRQAVSDGGLLQVGSRRHGALQCARWRQALPAPGLPQGSCYWRHAPLCRARWGQALPRGGLYQGSSRRHGCLLRWNGMLMTICSHH